MILCNHCSLSKSPISIPKAIDIRIKLQGHTSVIPWWVWQFLLWRSYSLPNFHSYPETLSQFIIKSATFSKTAGFRWNEKSISRICSAENICQSNTRWEFSFNNSALSMAYTGTKRHSTFLLPLSRSGIANLIRRNRISSRKWLNISSVALA